MKKNIFVLLVMFLCISCSQIRLEFDKEQNSVRTCRENIKFKNISIFEVDGSDTSYRISLVDSEKGSSILFLEKQNPGYESWSEKPFMFKPNRQYIISSTYFDSRAEIIVFTNEYAKVDSVINNFGCK